MIEAALQETCNLSIKNGEQTISNIKEGTGKRNPKKTTFTLITISDIDAMAPNDSNQLYNDVAHCIDRLVDTISEEISVAVSDLVLDGKIGLCAFFERHGMMDDGCERHVFMSTYQQDILKRVEKKLARKGFNCRVNVTDSGKKSLINYTTRVQHPMKKFLKLSTFLIIPLLGTVAALKYSMFFRNTQAVVKDTRSIFAPAPINVAIPNTHWDSYDKGNFPSKAEAESRGQGIQAHTVIKENMKNREEKVKTVEVKPHKTQTSSGFFGGKGKGGK